jgi:hypothetical protein
MQLRQVSLIDLRDTIVTPGGAEYLQRELPGCQILRDR